MKKLKTNMIYYTDGGTANNGKFGHQKSVICITNGKGKEIIFQDIGDKTNNEAELTAILTCLNMNHHEKIIYTDSQLSVKLILKNYKTKIGRLLILLNQIWEVKYKYNIIWTPREFNKAGWIIEEHLNL